MEELKELRKQISNDQTASIYADQFFSGLSDNKEAETIFTEIVTASIERYKKLSEIKDKLDDAGSFNQLLISVLRLFPSYGFIICNEFDKFAGLIKLIIKNCILI